MDIWCLCNQFRHPAVLAKMATTLDQVSAGRLDLGIGSGSIEDEHTRTGLEWGTFANGPGFGLHDGGRIGTPQVIVERLKELQALGFQQVVLFTHDRASDETLELLASTVITEF